MQSILRIKQRRSILLAVVIQSLQSKGLVVHARCFVSA